MSFAVDPLKVPYVDRILEHIGKEREEMPTLSRISIEELDVLDQYITGWTESSVELAMKFSTEKEYYRDKIARLEKELAKQHAANLNLGAELDALIREKENETKSNVGPASRVRTTGTTKTSK